MQSIPRRLRSALAVSVVTALALVGLTVTPAAAADLSVTDAEFRWSLNNEAGNRAFAPGTYNFMSAGIIPKTTASDPITSSEWLAQEGAVSIEKPDATGVRSLATWAGTSTSPAGTAIPSPTSGVYNGLEAVIDQGTGTVNPEAGTASIQWTGSFTVAFYSGMTQFYVKNPKLDVAAGGVGTITATLGGWATSMDDPDAFEPVAEVPGVVIANLSGVVVTETGFTVTPNYLGVAITAPADGSAQVTGTASSGSFPQEFVNFVAGTGAGSYWYSSGGATDAAKVANPFSVAYTTVEEEEPTGPVITIDAGTLEWGINGTSQGASPNGSCTFFVAGIGDGTEATYKTEDGNLHLIKRGVDGRAIDVTQENRCLPLALNDARQRALFINGTGSIDTETGTGSIQWTGAISIYSYGGLVPWYIKDPKLTLNGDGTGAITGEMGGFASSMENPTIKEPLPAEPVTFLDLKDVSVVDGVVQAIPVFAGVDYFPLNDAFDPDSGRKTESAIADYVKTANPQWGSFPESFVDFHYRTGLSSYWHTSGGGADPTKPPLPITIVLDGGLPEFGAFAPVTITSQPVPVNAVTGDDVSFTVTATTEGEEALSYQWEKSTNNGATWAQIEGATAATLTLPDAAATTTSTMVRVVVANGGHSNTSSSALLRVQDATQLAITYQPDPTAASRFEGANMRLSGAASGWPAPSVLWQRSVDNGATWVDFETATSFNLLLNDVSTEFDGSQFRAVLSNGFGTPVASNPVTVHVYPAEGPTLKLDPTRYASGTVFDPAVSNTIYALGGGMPSPSSGNVWVGIIEAEKWTNRVNGFVQADFVAGSPIQTSSNFVNGTFGPFGFTVDAGLLDANKSYLLVSASANKDDRSYDAVTPVLVTGQAAPAITTQPTSAKVLAGASTTLSVTASATPPVLTYQWQQRAGETWTDIADATNSTYSVTAASTTDFRVIVSNVQGSTTSEVATVSVLPQPTVTVSKTSGFNANGETVTVTGTGFLPNAPLTNATRAPIGAGNFGGAYVVFGKFADNWAPSAGGSGRNVIQQLWVVSEADAARLGGLAAGYVGVGADGSFTAELTVKTGQVDKTGNYGIYTFAGGGAVYAPFESYTPVTLVESAPQLVTSPQDVLAPVVPTSGPANAVFTAAATGSPTPTITWELKLAGGEWTAIEGATGTQLTLPYTAAHDGAQVRAVATSALGSAHGDAAVLTLGEQARVTTQPESVSVTAGDDAEFAVEASGEDAEIEWQVKNGSAWTAVGTGTELVVEASDVRNGAVYRAVVTASVPTTPAGSEFTVVSNEATVTLVAPTTPAADVPDAELGEAGGLTVTTSGRTFTVELGAEFANQYAGAWLHSDPEWLGWKLASGTGTVSFTAPDSIPAGSHRLVVFDAAGDVLGWVTVVVAADGSVQVLGATGLDIQLPLGIAGMLLLAGAVGVLVTHRRRVAA